MLSVAYLGNTNILVLAIFQQPETTDGPLVCLIISPSLYRHIVDFSNIILHLGKLRKVVIELVL